MAKRIPLAPVTKTRFGKNRRGQSVCIEAVTKDLTWVIGQTEDELTSWRVMHVATGIEVINCLATLAQCRRYIGSGEAQRDLGTLQAHARGEHAGRVTACAECDREAEAAEFRRQLHGRRAA